MAAWSGYGEGTEGEDRDLRVERIRQALEGGSFRVDGEAVAGKIVDAAVRSLRFAPFALRGEPAMAALGSPRPATLLGGTPPGGGGQAK